MKWSENARDKIPSKTNHKVPTEGKQSKPIEPQNKHVRRRNESPQRPQNPPRKLHPENTNKEKKKLVQKKHQTTPPFAFNNKDNSTASNEANQAF